MCHLERLQYRIEHVTLLVELDVHALSWIIRNSFRLLYNSASFFLMKCEHQIIPPSVRACAFEHEIFFYPSVNPRLSADPSTHRTEGRIYFLNGLLQFLIYIMCIFPFFLTSWPICSPWKWFVWLLFFQIQNIHLTYSITNFFEADSKIFVTPRHLHLCLILSNNSKSILTTLALNPCSSAKIKLTCTMWPSRER